MKASDNCIKLIKHWEGLKLEAYEDSVKVVTIGIGTTRYPNGKKVQLGDKCTEEEAEEYLRSDLTLIESKINRHFKNLNQNQFDALCSWIYNLGFGNLLVSTLKKKMLEDPNDPEIEKEWLKWIYAGRVKLIGLVARRHSEYALYSTGELNF
jgi:lysozyme